MLPGLKQSAAITGVVNSKAGASGALQLQARTAAFAVERPSGRRGMQDDVSLSPVLPSPPASKQHVRECVNVLQHSLRAPGGEFVELRSRSPSSPSQQPAQIASGSGADAVKVGDWWSQMEGSPGPIDPRNLTFWESHGRGRCCGLRQGPSKRRKPKPKAAS